ncbi:hypothetical protein [Empedobacter tilapiae]|uniref:hypothetical protein n=1 Tax=Empedobacter tilapiae TaxID=2491114 RepID=UPI0028D4B65C|nr:hypothetical protein [Empedobacter tilapiae]
MEHYSQNNSAPSFLLISEGYDNNQHGKYPGFDMWITNGYGFPIEMKIFNNSKYFVDHNKLREVGIVFNHWFNEYNEGRWAFRDQYKLTDFKEIRSIFDIKLENYNPHLPNATLQTVVLSADLRINYYNESGKHVRGDLLSLIFCNPNNYDINNNPNDSIYWQSWNATNDDLIDGVPYRRISIHANKVGISNFHNVNQNFNHIDFDFIPLIKTFLPSPPENLTYENAIIVGYDIYSSTRGADISFSVKNINLIGIKN